MSNEELVAAIHAGENRMGELWEQVVGLVKWKARRIITAIDLSGSSCGVELEDLVQSGYLALVKAVETYEPTAGAFSTWLGYHLKNAYAEATNYRTTRGKKEPLNNCLSLDSPLTDDVDNDTFMEVVADPNSLKQQESVEEAVWQEELCAAVETALSTVPETYREILRLRYWDNLSLETIGDFQGISKERVRQLECKGLQKLRQPRNACHLRPFYDFDFYCGTGMGAFQHTGMSIQERYLMIEEDRRERAEQQRKERESKQRQERFQSEYTRIVERVMQEAQAKVAKMTPEEKSKLLEKYGYA